MLPHPPNFTFNVNEHPPHSAGHLFGHPPACQASPPSGLLPPQALRDLVRPRSTGAVADGVFELAKVRSGDVLGGQVGELYGLIQSLRRAVEEEEIRQ